MFPRLRRAARPLALAAVLAAAASCAVNPATGERQLSLVSEAEEIRMGRQADEQIVQAYGVYEDEGLQRYVEELGMRLAAESERPDLPWTFRVLDDPTVNAFALPGGFVYITRGIMSHIGSEAELAGILGHEIGHITARHSVNQMSRQQLTQLGLGLGMILVPEARPFGDLAQAGAQLLQLKYSRDDENEADELGIRYMLRESYDPLELSDVMSMLARSSELQGSRGSLPGWLSTHPDPGDRAERIERLVAERPLSPDTLVVQRTTYLQRIDGMVFGTDPREGFFRDGVFYHPELAFRVDVPDGWSHQNTKQAVQSVSPEQDAILLLTLAQASPDAALREFASQQGLEVGSADRGAINGLDAAAADFRARTEQGTLRGRVAFIAHGGNTYRLLGYSPERLWSQRSGVLTAAIASFAPEDDPAILNVRPDRLEMVSVGEPIPFRSFLDRYPSAAEPQVVALINGVEVGGTVPTDRLLKRVLGGG